MSMVNHGGMILTGKYRRTAPVHFVHHKFLTDWPRHERGPPWWEDGD